MAVEAKRGCGYRKVGGIYLVSSGGGMPCDRLPLLLDVCPTCSAGIKQTRGWTWIDVAKLVGGKHADCQDGYACPLCFAPESMGRAGLLWIGEAFYKTPQDFAREGYEMGFSRRIKSVPRGFKVGETWVLLAHPKAVHTKEVDNDGVEEFMKEYPLLAKEMTTDALIKKFSMNLHKPGVFHVWLPERIEKLVFESQRGTPDVELLETQGITPVFIPDTDMDHQGSVYDKIEPTDVPEDDPDTDMKLAYNELLENEKRRGE